MQGRIIEAYRNHLKIERNLKDRTINAYIKNLSLVEEKAGDLLAVKTRGEIVQAIAALQDEKGWNPKGSTTWRCSHDVVFFYKWALLDGYIEVNPYPFNGFRKPQYHAVQFTNEEEWALLTKHSIHLTDQDKLMLWTLWDTGLRREELRLLDQEDFNLEERIIFLPEGKSKGGYGQRYVALSKKTYVLAVKHFRALRHMGIRRHVFCGENFKRINGDEIYARITRAGKVFSPKGFIKINPRKMRHSVPIRMVTAGAQDLAVMTMMGHANKEMTQRYTHSNPKFAKQSRDKYLTAS